MKKQKARPKQIYMQRIKCDCMAQKHDLINNCLSCGKIVCAQEGQGNCLYCGKLVTKPEGLFIDDSQQLFPSLSKEEQQKIAIQRSKAIQHKNILVERDKSQNQNQNIFDEQVDYYEISQNKWLDQGDRQNAIDRILEKEHFVEEQSLKTKIKFDTLTGQFVREQFSYDQEAFKKQGQKFLEQKEKEAKQAKEKVAKERQNWDERLLRSEKMRDLCGQLLQKPKNAEINLNKPEKRQEKGIQFIIEQQS